MASGLLTGKMTRDRVAKLPDDDWRKHDPSFQEPRLSEHLVLVERLRAVGARYGRLPGEVAIAWTLGHPAVTGAIVGARSAKQAEGVMNAGTLRLTSREKAEIETPEALAGEGARLVLTARRQERLDALKKEAESLGTAAVSVTGDAREEQTAIETVKAAVDAFGRLDILINNTGAGNYKNLVDTSTEDYDGLMDTNVRSTFLFTRHAVPVMLKQKSGTILMISSMAGVYGFGGEAVYCMTKFAQVGFAQALDRELRESGIKVGAICPGRVKTEFAIGKGRTEEGVSESDMLDPEDVYAVAQIAHHRSADADHGGGSCLRRVSCNA